ncbi:MAG: hypothetical protein FWD65_01800 [Coriobacteriia bacterium]|nr:hypothetical protein [Coriobacteriia bacterium]
MKLKKLIPLLVGLVVIWGAYLGFMFYLAGGGIQASGFAGIPLKTMEYAFCGVSVVVTAIWGAVWWYLHVKADD